MDKEIKHNIFIKGEKINLCILKNDYCEGEYMDWLNSEEVCLGNSHHKFPVSKMNLIDFITTKNDDRNSIHLAIIETSSSRHVGNVALQNIDYLNRQAEFAIILGEKGIWGKGFGTEACRLLMKHGFKELNLRRIYCATYENNKGMISIANKVGMMLEGRRRKAVYKNGNYLDVVEFGILKNEFYL